MNTIVTMMIDDDDDNDAQSSQIVRSTKIFNSNSIH